MFRLAVVLLALLVVACSAPTPTRTLPLTPTTTATPVPTSAATLTPMPPATPTPRPTPTPTVRIDIAVPTPEQIPPQAELPAPTITYPTPEQPPWVTPTPPARPTQTPRPTVAPTTDPAVLACLLDHGCSGLFRWEQVNKSAAARSRVYWVDDALPAQTQAVIRTRVMPALAEWTHGEWVESQTAPEKVSGVKAPVAQLSWLDGSRRSDRLCGTTSPVRGCAEDDHVWLWATSATTGRAYPPEVLFEIAVHEALHALWEARHRTDGVMCKWPGCPVARSVSAGGYSWDLKMLPSDLEFFTLYGLPALESGMTLAEVAALFGVSIAVTPTPTPLSAPDTKTAEELAIAAGTRCKGLASLRKVVWEIYPRLNADGVLTLSGSIEAGAPSIKDARKSYGGNIHPAFTLYAIELGTNERGNVSSVGRVWPSEMANRVSGKGSPNAFAEVYNVTRDRFEVVAQLPASVLRYEDLHITVWSSLVETLSRPTGSTAGLGSCKVWR